MAIFLAGGLRVGAMYGFETEVDNPMEAEGSKPSDPVRTLGLVGKDILEHIFCDNYIEPARPLYQLHRSIIDEHETGGYFSELGAVDSVW
ncbi:MAG: hypothetical protein MZV63_09950 [Marinilabiliales bacterium]|nr:hypothetical protein [Marinilabiliales bacterium]